MYFEVQTREAYFFICQNRVRLCQSQDIETMKYLMSLLSKLDSPDIQIQSFCCLFTAPKIWGLGSQYMGPKAQALSVLTIGNKVITQKKKAF